MPDVSRGNFEEKNLIFLAFVSPEVGLGVLTGERLFFRENERNYQEESHRFENKNEHIERVLKNIGSIIKRIRTWNERKLLENNVKIMNAF